MPACDRRTTRFGWPAPTAWLGRSLVLVLAAFLFGCSSGGRIDLRALGDASALRSPLTTLAYASTDVNTADVYMTDLPSASLDPGADLRSASGVLVHIHLFITPLAGETPIARSACSAVVRCVILAEGEVGVYGGGGFLAPRGTPGDQVLSGAIRDASCRLTAHSPNFADRLGPATLSTTFAAPRDEDQAKRLERALTAIMAELPVVRGIDAPPGPGSK